MQYFYEFYLPTCTCRQNIGHYQALVLRYLSEGKSWPEIFTLLHITKLCCRNKLAMPYTSNFDYQIDQIVDGKIDPSFIPFTGFNYLTYINGPLFRNNFPPKVIPHGDFVPLNSIEASNNYKEPQYTGRPTITNATVPIQEKFIGLNNGVPLNVQRIATKYICA